MWDQTWSLNRDEIIYLLLKVGISFILDMDWTPVKLDWLDFSTDLYPIFDNFIDDRGQLTFTFASIWLFNGITVFQGIQELNERSVIAWENLRLIWKETKLEIVLYVESNSPFEYPFTFTFIQNSTILCVIILAYKLHTCLNDYTRLILYFKFNYNKFILK